MKWCGRPYENQDSYMRIYVFQRYESEKSYERGCLKGKLLHKRETNKKKEAQIQLILIQKQI